MSYAARAGDAVWFLILDGIRYSQNFLFWLYLARTNFDMFACGTIISCCAQHLDPPLERYASGGVEYIPMLFHFLCLHYIQALW